MNELFIKRFHAGVIFLLLALMLSCSGQQGAPGADPGVTSSPTLSIFGQVVDPIGNYSVPGAAVTVRDTTNSVLSTTTSSFYGFYTLENVPASTDMYMNVSKAGYAGLNTEILNFSNDMIANLPIMPAATAKYMADAFSGASIGNTWGEKAYTDKGWFFLDIYDTQYNEVSGITVKANSGGPAIVYNNGADTFSSAPPTAVSFDQPLVGGYVNSAGIYVFTLTDVLGHTQSLKLPLVPGEITYAAAEWGSSWGYSVSGHVASTDGTDVAGVTINCSIGSNTPATTTTDAQGNYTILNRVNRTYTITPACSVNCTFSPPALTTTVASADVTGQNFIINESTMPTTSNAAGVTDTTARLIGSYTNPFGADTYVWFEYGLTASYGSKTTQQFFVDPARTLVYADVTGLQQLTTYHYRIVTKTAELTFYGQDKTFTTYITPEILASGLDRPHALALDADNVYVAEPNAIKKVPKAGGTVTTLASLSSIVWGFAADSTSVYWSDGNGINKIGLNGGAVTNLSPTGSTFSLAIDDANVYWSSAGILSVGKNGGATNTLVSGAIGGGTGIAVDANNVYWTIYGIGGKIRKVPKSGGSATDLATADDAVYLAVDSTSVYFPDMGSLKKVGLSGGPVTVLSPDGGVGNLVLDGAYIYWIGSEGDWPSLLAIKKMNINGGPATILSTGYGGANWYGLAVDGTHVYWTEGYTNDGVIKRVPK